MINGTISTTIRTPDGRLIAAGTLRNNFKSYRELKSPNWQMCAGIRFFRFLTCEICLDVTGEVFSYRLTKVQKGSLETFSGKTQANLKTGTYSSYTTISLSKYDVNLFRYTISAKRIKEPEIRQAELFQDQASLILPGGRP